MGVMETMIEALGLEMERFALVWCSSAEADRFVNAVRDMTAVVKELGPSPYRRNEEEVAGSCPLAAASDSACQRAGGEATA
jgi:F420-non-reducing hydrogenase iron-sulfur subunit